MKMHALIGASALLALASAAHAQSINGTVKKIDDAQGKLTIDHGPIKNLDMDSMTMVFRAGDPTMLKGLKAGDKIKFDADRVNGQITVTKLQKSK
jgi:Cu(I)/Ag(I) efflux system protein CusF